MGKKTLKFITNHTHSMVMQKNKNPFGTKMTTIFRKGKSFLIALEFGKSNSPDAIQKVTVV